MWIVYMNSSFLFISIFGLISSKAHELISNASVPTKFFFAFLYLFPKYLQSIIRKNMDPWLFTSEANAQNL